MTLRKLVPIAATLLVLPGAAAGQSEPPAYQTASLPFTTTKPGSPTGMTLAIDYRNPADPNAKPHAVQKLVVRLHPGTRIDTAVPEQCKASDSEFAQQGANACPPGSRVGAGETEFDTGSPTPDQRIAKTQVTLFNNENQLILFFETTNLPGPPLRVAARSRIEGGTITTEVPPIPGFPPPEPFLATKTVRETFDLLTRGSGDSLRNYITTPPTCPGSGRWTNSLDFTYRNGTTQTVSTSSPCTATLRGSRPPRIQVFGVKRRGCTHRSFLVRVAVSERGAKLSRAELSLDGRRLVTTQRRGFSRRIAVRRLAVGAHELVATAVDAAGNSRSKTLTFRPCR